MKPDWNEAPEWANYLAMDENGVWFWYEHEPNSIGDDEWFAHKGNCLPATCDATKWRETLEERPKSEDDAIGEMIDHIDSILVGIPYKPCGAQKIADEVIE